VAVFDASTASRRRGQGPGGPRRDPVRPASKQIFAFNHRSGTATIIDPVALKVTANLQIGGALEFGRADGKGNVWVNAEDKNQTVRIDSRKGEVKARFDLAPCQEPTGWRSTPRTGACSSVATTR